ncbi:FecCD family ABC transporter permease [Leisingera methylohalidivorans]|uniref:ABC transporter permease n=1 Tax=Leisingera methylohalidivorans DSM 14336 TaxID=999552 RepID=V9W137_9RHOB|nr:iron ABC transporter permease [Leisingera methylohalidivorans]AHD03818.1 ABC transporter permease [Leisingera methylohalidivorans DSM 14336]
MLADPLSYHRFGSRRASCPLIFLSLVLTAAVLFGLTSGAVPIPASVLWNTLFGFEGPRQDFIILNLRLPRTLLAALTGASLAVSGAVIQSLLRNPLASPKIVGINSGAAFAVLGCTLILPAHASGLAPYAAAAGGLAAGGLVWIMASRGQTDAARLTLIGIATGFALDAAVEFLLVTQTGPEFSAPMIWLTGSLWGRGWPHLAAVAPVLTVLILLAFLLSFRLDLQYLGPARAAALGARNRLERGAAFLVAVLLAAISVSVVGVIGFVGLMAPHIAMRLVGGRHWPLLPAAALTGAIFCAGADAAGRAIAPPVEISAGIITALLGAPFFIWLLVTENRSQRGTG